MQKLKIGVVRPTIYVTRITIFSSHNNKLLNFVEFIFEVLILVLHWHIVLTKNMSGHFETM